MRRILTTSIALLLAALPLSAQKKLVFMPHWVPQAQFTGFYVAKELGFYEAEGLDVEIRHNAALAGRTVEDHLLKGDVDVAGTLLLSAIKLESEGHNIINILQLTQESSLCCIFDRPVKSIKSLDGMKVGRWVSAYHESTAMIEAAAGINVEWVDALDPTNLFLFQAVNATLALSYNELNTIRAAKGDIPDDCIMRFSEYGFDCPEDGLYVKASYYRNHRSEIDAFVRASIKGWEYADANREKAVDITLEYVRDEHAITNRMKESLMLEEYLSQMVNPNTGKIDFAPVGERMFNELVSSLLNVGHIKTVVSHKQMFE